MVVRDVPLNGSPGRVLAGAPPRFNMVGLHWQGSGTPWYRTRSASGRWSAWLPADDDWGRVGVWRRSNPDWVGTANAIQIRNVGTRDAAPRVPPLEPAGERSRPSRAARRCADDHLARRLAGRRGDPARAAAVRTDAAVRARPPHRQLEQLHVRAVGVDRARHRGLPREGKRLERHRLQRARRSLRPGVRRPLRRHRQERHRRALARVQHRLGRRRADRHVLELGADRRGAAGARQPARVAARPRAHRSAFACERHLGRQLEVRRRHGGQPARRLRPPRHLLDRLSGHALYKLLPAIAQQVAQTGGPKLYAPVAAGTLGGPIRFTGKLSAPLPWTVTVP